MGRRSRPPTPPLGAAALVVAFVAATLAAADPVSGSTQPPAPVTDVAPESTTSSVTVAPETTTTSVTVAPETTTTSVTVAPETTATSVTVAPETTPTAEPPPADPADTAPDDATADPLVDEEQGEAAPETDETVPPPGGAYAGQRELEPARVLWSSVRAAETKMADALWIHRGLVEDVRSIRLRHKELRVEQRSLDADAQEAAREIRDAEATLRERAVAAFVSNDAQIEAIIGSLDAADHDRVLDLQVRRRLLDAALRSDGDAIGAYLELRARIDSEVLANVDALRLTEQTMRAAIVEVDEAEADVIQAENELEAFRAGSAVYIDDVVFPVAAPYSVPLIDSWGFPRMPGTPDEHWHEGIDIFAPAGTPLLATERGVVTRVGSGRLGGLTIWLRGESGTDWYYAHLQSHVPDLVVGSVVEAGDVVGYVGNTGNAISTPSHLHLQMHPDGGDPVNPYPLLKVISDRDRSGG